VRARTAGGHQHDRHRQPRSAPTSSGDRYNLDVVVPLFDPGLIDHPRIPIHLSAIGPNVCSVAGEVADAVRLHPVCTATFIDEAVLPNLARAAARAGRALSDVEVCMTPLIGTAPTAERLEQVVRTVRARVSFSLSTLSTLSTPSYRRTFELHGWGDVAVRASELSRAQRWDDLPGLVTDEMLHTVATIGTYDEIADRLNERYRGRVDRIEFSIPVNDEADAETLRGILADLR
jgi:alkanesulfonate monooxygenase SsuD/methylene tetrahydromethanopterin reductase-like flavin-dependent oxidoreductase (luciferase family)